MTQQSTFMILAPVAEAKEAALRELLRSMNQAPGFADPHNPIVPFYQFAALHVARFLILEPNTNDDIREHGVEPSYWPKTLAFLGDIDGRTDIFLAELAVRCGAGLVQIFSHCAGFEREKTNLLQWMTGRNKSPSANYVNWRGRTVTQIREEAALANALRLQLNQFSENTAGGTHSSTDPQVLRRRLIEFTAGEVAARRLRLGPPQPTPPGWYLRNIAHLIALPLALLLLSPLLIIGAPLFFLHLRRLEDSDPENVRRPERDHLKQLTDIEDVDVTNHFNVFGQVKPGRFRGTTIQLLLLVLDYASRHVYRRGYLTRIQTIHFARWVLLDDNKRVFFASNYDGSEESYMDDFINKVAWGLNLVFSNGVGYPRTRWLIKGGAEYEEKYKRTLRRNQLPSITWYKAYPGLTAVDLARNTRIRQGLEADDLTARQAQEWLALL